MLKSDYIREQNEHTLLGSGYICVEEEKGVQTWIDMQGSGKEIYHCVYQYPVYVEDAGLLSPKETLEGGGFYFMVQSDPKTVTKTASVDQAVKASRS